VIETHEHKGDFKKDSAMDNSEQSPRAQDRARIAFGCRMITQTPPMPSTIPERFTAHGAAV